MLRAFRHYALAISAKVKIAFCFQLNKLLMLLLKPQGCGFTLCC